MRGSGRTSTIGGGGPMLMSTSTLVRAIAGVLASVVASIPMSRDLRVSMVPPRCAGRRSRPRLGGKRCQFRFDRRQAGSAQPAAPPENQARSYGQLGGFRHSECDAELVRSDHTCLGSSASLKPSPTRLNESTSTKIDKPGQTAIHGALSM